jgi:hypothetical protein
VITAAFFVSDPEKATATIVPDNGNSEIICELTMGLLHEVRVARKRVIRAKRLIAEALAAAPAVADEAEEGHPPATSRPMTDPVDSSSVHSWVQEPMGV